MALLDIGDDDGRCRLPCVVTACVLHRAHAPDQASDEACPEPAARIIMSAMSALAGIRAS